jgi:hypothetical protein
VYRHNARGGEIQLCKKTAAEASKNEEMAAAAMAQEQYRKGQREQPYGEGNRTKAFLLGKEGEAEETQCPKLCPVRQPVCQSDRSIKNNESAARIYVSTLDSSITILEKKMEATQK